MLTPTEAKKEAARLTNRVKSYHVLLETIKTVVKIKKQNISEKQAEKILRLTEEIQRLAIADAEAVRFYVSFFSEIPPGTDIGE